VTELPAFAKCSAVDSPVNPAPMIVTSVSVEPLSGSYVAPTGVKARHRDVEVVMAESRFSG